MGQKVELVYSGSGGARLDRFVAEQCADLSRASVQRLIEAGEVVVNGRTAKASHRLNPGDAVRVAIEEGRPQAPRPAAMRLSIIYEDDDCVVIDKPPGMVVHPATSHQQDTLVNGLLALYPDMMAMVDPSSADGRRPGIVHRLDKDTSGLIVVARHEASKKVLQRQFKSRRVTKKYTALLDGRLAEPEGRIAVPLGRDPNNRQRMAARPDGRAATTGYRSLAYLVTAHGYRQHYTLVDVALLTGRTHQIRVHFAHLGHPVVGDRIYGRRKQRIACPRQFLHASELGFRLPSDGRQVTFQSPLPHDLELVLSQLAQIV